jgi:hypothetical protein
MDIGDGFSSFGNGSGYIGCCRRLNYDSMDIGDGFSSFGNGSCRCRLDCDSLDIGDGFSSFDNNSGCVGCGRTGVLRI